MVTSGQKLYVAVFPWLAFGHIIYFFELAKLIASKGHKLSFIFTPRNITRLPELHHNLSLLITFVPLTLPQLPQLPENTEATTDVPFQNIDHFKKAFDGLKPGLTKFLESSVPDWIIHNFAHHWLFQIAGRLGISRAFFLIMRAWFPPFFRSTSYIVETGNLMVGVDQMSDIQEWVTYPTKTVYKSNEVREMKRFVVGVNASGVTDWYRHGCSVSGCDVFVRRHCYEFEPKWLDVLEEVLNKHVVPLGLMSLSLK